MAAALRPGPRNGRGAAPKPPKVAVALSEVTAMHAVRFGGFVRDDAAPASAPGGIVRAIVLIGASWCSVAWQAGDSRPLLYFVPLVLAPSLLASAIMRLPCFSSCEAEESVAAVQQRRSAAIASCDRECQSDGRCGPDASSPIA